MKEQLGGKMVKDKRQMKDPCDISLDIYIYIHMYDINIPGYWLLQDESLLFHSLLCVYVPYSWVV